MFIKDMYRDEIRDGWFVTADIKKVWNRQLEVWAEIDRLCRKHDITYWAAYGTLLGAVRHKGFVPWDDDFDLWMMRPDYNRFLTVLDEFKEPFAVGLNRFSVVRISHEETTLIDLNDSLDDSPKGLMIEIFPLDIALDDTRDGYLAFNALNELMGTVYNFDAIVQHVQNGGLTVNDWDVIEQVHALDNFDAQFKFLNIYAENLFGQSSSIFTLEDGLRDMSRPTFSKKYFRETIHLPFETVKLPAPKMFDEVLTTYYGDWRTPVNDGQKRLGYFHSADIPWREFLQHVDVKKILSK